MRAAVPGFRCRALPSPCSGVKVRREESGHPADCGLINRPQTAVWVYQGPPARQAAQEVPALRAGKGRAVWETVSVALPEGAPQQLPQTPILESPTRPQGSISALAGFSLRITAWAGKPHHNITRYCVTPRVTGSTPKTVIKLQAESLRIDILPAAGYTTGRYVKLL